MLVRKADDLVKHRECIPKSTISLLSNNMQSIRFKHDILFLCDTGEVIRHILYLNSIKVKYLTTGKNSRKNFMLFCGRENKNCIGRRFFQRFQKRIESCLRKHVYLVNNIDFIFPDLWRNSHLFNQATDIIHRIIRRRIQFVDTKRIPLLKRFTALASTAGFYLRRDLLTIY